MVTTRQAPPNQERAMRHLRRSVIAVVALALSAAVTAGTAQTAGAHPGHHRHDRLVVRPIHWVDGLSAPQVLGRIRSLIYTLPAAQNPWAGGNPCVPIGRTGHLLWQGRVSTCTVTEGTAVVVGGWTVACGTMEQAPYFAMGESAQRRCAIEADHADVVSRVVTVDGAHAVQMRTPCFEIVTRQQAVTIPQNNPFGLTPGPGTFVGHAWMGVLRHLPVGRHTIGGKIVFSDGTTFVVDPPHVVYVLRRPHHH
jgi:hypothetical protein